MRFDARVFIASLALVLSVNASALTVQERISRRQVPAEQAEKNADRLLTEINWHQSLDAAKATAQREGKLVFWMHMLGDLEGFT
jgi:hypothetical protein